MFVSCFLSIQTALHNCFPVVARIPAEAGRGGNLIENTDILRLLRFTRKNDVGIVQNFM